MPAARSGHTFDDSASAAPEPDLDPWRPTDGLAGVQDVDRLAECLFTDARWRHVHVRAQGRSHRGWAVLIEFSTDDVYQRWVMYDPAKFCDPPD